jgi:hypothetical protein
LKRKTELKQITKLFSQHKISFLKNKVNLEHIRCILALNKVEGKSQQ